MALRPTTPNVSWQPVAIWKISDDYNLPSDITITVDVYVGRLENYFTRDGS